MGFLFFVCVFVLEYEYLYMKKNICNSLVIKSVVLSLVCTGGNEGRSNDRFIREQEVEAEKQSRERPLKENVSV